MLAIEARKMGYGVQTFSPDTNSPTGQIADKEWVAHYDDLDQVRAFAKEVDVITFEFENVPFATVQAAEEFAPVRPKGSVLHTTQHRLREKTFLRDAGIPVTPFERVTNEAELRAALLKLGYPAILKTAGFGYDGKGQVKIFTEADVPTALSQLANQESILEAFVDFERELSIVAARGADGSFEHYGAVENIHKNHILDITIAPGRISPQVASNAIELARVILDKLDVVGVLCVELFETKTGALVVNELAPRPHNSGHFTFDASMTSQFAQQLRAVCHVPLGSTEQLRSAVMVNLLGDLWENGEPNWSAALAIGGVHLHLYGKSSARPGRKMGHLTVMAESVEVALANARLARNALQSPQKA
jgi:5-(carboxyamino)imidazole ribonucleotide synthase